MRDAEQSSQDGLLVPRLVGLRQGVRVFSPQRLPLEERLSLSQGSEAARVGRTGLPYMSGSFKPRTPWRSLNVTERALVICDEGAGPEACVALVRLPDAALAPMAAAGLGDVRSRPDLDRALTHPEFPRACKVLEQHVRRYCDRGAPLTWHRIYCGPADLETVTVSLGRPQFVGMHVDHWDELPAERASQARNRMLINLGREPRYLLFVNLTMAQVRYLCGSPPPDRRGEGPGHGQQNVLHNLVVTFFESHPHYPITRLRVDPGEAYIAPTENVIHDGSSAGSASVDVNLQIRGNFGLRPSLQ